MLDLAGYTDCQPLHRMRLLEPSFGGGAFLLAAVARLLRVLRRWVTQLLSAWLVSGDFLLHPLPGRFDVVVGNPPYVRQELIAPALLGQYRKLYASLFDRADLYVPFMTRTA